MVSMQCNVLLPIQILVPFVHACNDSFSICAYCFSVLLEVCQVKHTGGSCCKRTPPIASSEASTR